MKTFAVATTLIAAFATTTGAARADDFHHGHHAFSYHYVDELANAVMQRAGALAEVARRNSSYGFAYKHLYNDTYEMYGLAAHIHELAHHHGSILHIRKDVEKLDKLFHHIEDLIAGLRPYGASFHHGGHSHGIHIHIHRGGPSRTQLRRMRLMADDLGHTLHKLRDVLRYATAPAPVVVPAPAGPSAFVPAYKTSPKRFVLKAGNRKIGFSLLLN